MRFADATESRLTPVIKVILVTNIVLYLLVVLPFIGSLLIQWGALIPAPTFKGWQLWRLFTYMFLHDPYSPFHILFNMLGLWWFGNDIEKMWGSRRFAWFYLISGVGSGALSIIHLWSPVMSFTPVIGASGAILAVLTVCAYYFPKRELLLFFIFPVNIRLVVIGYAVISLFGSLNPRSIVSHLTHLGGILVAIGYLRLYPRALGWWQERTALNREKKQRRHVEETVKQDRFFKERIDPILAKISLEGMDALTSQERRLLKKTAKSKERDKLKKSKILPFDLFR